jgi:hypothetical protein
MILALGGSLDEVPGGTSKIVTTCTTTVMMILSGTLNRSVRESEQVLARILSQTSPRLRQVNSLRIPTLSKAMGSPAS